MSSVLSTTVLLTELKRIYTKSTSNGYLNLWYVKGKEHFIRQDAQMLKTAKPLDET
jgi:hypothetical protein